MKTVDRVVTMITEPYEMDHTYRWTDGTRKGQVEVLLGRVNINEDEAKVHLLRHLAWEVEVRPSKYARKHREKRESLRPICGNGQGNWTHDNFHGPIEDVTCVSCLRILRTKV